MSFKIIYTCVTTTQNKIQNHGPFKNTIHAKVSMVACVRPLSWQSPLPFQSIPHSSIAPAYCSPLSLTPLSAIPQLLKLSSCSLTLTELDGLCWLESQSFSSYRTWLFSLGLCKICCRPKLPLPLAPAAGPSPPGLLPLGLGGRSIELARLVIRRDNQVIWSS